MATIEEIKDTNTPHPDTECNIGHLCDSFEALSLLSNEKFEAKSSTKMVRLSTWLRPVYTEFIDLKKDTATRLGTAVNGEDNKFSIAAENVAEFNKTILTAAAKPITVPTRLKLEVADLEGVKVSASTILRLRWLLSDLDE